MIGTYYVDDEQFSTCLDCAEETGTEGLTKAVNESHEPGKCDVCGEEISFAGQTFQIRPCMSVKEWDDSLMR